MTDIDPNNAMLRATRESQGRVNYERDRPAEAAESLSSQIDRLANFIMREVPGEPSQSEGAVDTAIRWMRSVLTAPPPQPEQADLVEAFPTIKYLMECLETHADKFPVPQHILANVAVVRAVLSRPAVEPVAWREKVQRAIDLIAGLHEQRARFVLEELLSTAPPPQAEQADLVEALRKIKRICYYPDRVCDIADTIIAALQKQER